MNEKLLREYLEYDPETGNIYWIKPYNRHSKVKTGDIAGTKWNGYIRVKFLKKTYGAHRLAWFLYHGYWPKDHIDHINGNPSDNRLINLRECTHKQNHANRKTEKCVSGFKGVQPKGKKWQSRVCFNYKRYYLGLFDTAEEAAIAYDKKAKELFGEFARTNF